MPSKIVSQTTNDAFSFGDTPFWVKEYPIPTPKKEYDRDLVLIHSDIQYNHITKENHYRYVYYLNSIKGVNQLGKFYDSFNPEYQNFILHRVNIHRERKIISLRNNLHIEHDQTVKQIAYEEHSKEITISLFFNETKVGDIVEISYTVKGIAPNRQGQLQLLHTMLEKLRGKTFIRVLSNKNSVLDYKLINIEAKSKIQIDSSFKSIELSIHNDRDFKKLDTPSWYVTDKQVYVFDNTSWVQCVNTHLKNFSLDTPPSVEMKKHVQKLTKGVAKQENKINAVLNYIQSDITYLESNLHLPKNPTTVLKQKLGDCTSKTLLTVKMLECLGITSWPLLTRYKGVDERHLHIYSGQMFNHSVIEFVYENDTLIFDPTMSLQRGTIREKYTKNFRYGLRVVGGNDGLTKMRWNLYNAIDVTTTIDGITDEWYHSVNWSFTFKGQLANKNNNLYSKGGIKYVFDNIAPYIDGWHRNETIGNKDNIDRYPHIYLKDFDCAYTFDMNHLQSTMTLQSAGKVQSLEVLGIGKDDGSWKYSVDFRPVPLFEYLVYREPEEIGQIITLPSVNKITEFVKINVQPLDSNQLDTTIFENDWIKYNKKVWANEDTVYAAYSAEFYKTHLDSSRYMDVVKTMDMLRDDMIIPLTVGAAQSKKENQEYKIDQKLYKKVEYSHFMVLLIGLFTLFSIFRKKR